MSEFVARQPIFNHHERVYGYELLFRSSPENSFTAGDGDVASCHVADHLMTLGRVLTGGRNAFINCTRDFLLKDFARLLPRENTVVEILESVEPDEKVLAACRKLKQSGYKIALDDFAWADHFKPLAELADIIKVDFLSTSASARQSLAQRFGPRGVRMLAEKLETREDFELALDLGYHYFQGFFFCKPQIVQGRKIFAFKPHYLRILREVSRRDMDFAAVEAIIRHEVSLCYRLMHYVNSAAFGFRSEIRSVRHALTLLGEAEVKKLVLLVTAVTLAEDKPPELIVTALARARCCELLARQAHLEGHSETLFLVGLFSVLDAMLGQPMDQVLPLIALPDEAKHALMGGENFMRDIFEIALAYEKADWVEVSQRAIRAELSEAQIPDIYFAALHWAKTIFDISPRN